MTLAVCEVQSEPVQDNIQSTLADHHAATYVHETMYIINDVYIVTHNRHESTFPSFSHHKSS